MAKKLYVGGIPYSTTEERLVEVFSQVGSVVSAKVMIDRDTQRSRGFAFVEMSTDDEAQAAINEFDQQDLDGRRIRVSEARPPERRNNRY